jgi:flagellar hook-basal body complex protein FliE
MSIEAIAGISAQLGTQPGTSIGQQSSGGGFAAHMDAAVGKVDSAQHVADSALAELASGENVDLHGTMIKLQQADIAMRTMVSVRDKVVDAYQTLMNMTI